MAKKRVSIPERVSDDFPDDLKASKFDVILVSIPERVSDDFPVSAIGSTAATGEFQSLKGFRTIFRPEVRVIVRRAFGRFQSLKGFRTIFRS